MFLACLFKLLRCLLRVLAANVQRFEYAWCRSAQLAAGLKSGQFLVGRLRCPKTIYLGGLAIAHEECSLILEDM